MGSGTGKRSVCVSRGTWVCRRGLSGHKRWCFHVGWAGLADVGTPARPDEWAQVGPSGALKQKGTPSLRTEKQKSDVSTRKRSLLVETT